MPANYAHYRMGLLTVDKLPASFRRPIGRFRRFFDVGLHGPDIFFHYNPFWNNPVTQMGSDFHRKTGRDFFTAACAAWKAAPSEAATAYLYGLLGHYCLDSIVHPYVCEKDKAGIARHAELETDFDRYLLRLDGKVPPQLQSVSEHMHLTRGEAVTAAQFFSPATPAQVYQSVRRSALFARLLAHKKRKLLKLILKPANENVRDHVMMSQANPRCQGMYPELMALYNLALERYPLMLEQLQAHLDTGAEFGEYFDAIFG